MSTPLIQVENATFHAGDRNILQDANWKLNAGQHTAILGCNGSGKTTLLRIATGQIRTNRGGRVLWRGEEQIDLRELRQSVGWVANDIATTIPYRELVLPLVVSGRYAQIGLRPPIRDIGTDEEREKARQLLSNAGCEHLANRRFRTLSQGEQRSVLLLRSLMALPLLIILDEPCSGLDPGARERFLGLLNRVLAADEAPTLVMVTHHVEEIVPDIEHVLVVANGQIVKQGSKADVLTEATLAEIYEVAPSTIAEKNGRFWPIW